MLYIMSIHKCMLLYYREISTHVLSLRRCTIFMYSDQKKNRFLLTFHVSKTIVKQIKSHVRLNHSTIIKLLHKFDGNGCFKIAHTYALQSNELVKKNNNISCSLASLLPIYTNDMHIFVGSIPLFLCVFCMFCFFSYHFPIFNQF